MGSRLLDSAIDTALGAVWLSLAAMLGGMAMTALVTAILYFRSPEAAWIYSTLRYALVYMGGMATLFLIIVGFALAGIRRRKLVEKQNGSRFKSGEKGYLDHWLHYGESNRRYISVLAEIGTDMSRIGTCSFKIGQKLSTANNDAKHAHRIVTEGAATLDSYAAKMERSIKTLEEVTGLLLESTMALASLAAPASEGNTEKLESSREACIGLLQRAEVAIKSTKNFRQTAITTLGISQDINSAMNRVMYGLESIIDLLSQAVEKWKETLVILDHKLAS